MKKPLSFLALFAATQLAFANPVEVKPEEKTEVVAEQAAEATQKQTQTELLGEVTFEDGEAIIEKTSQEELADLLLVPYESAQAAIKGSIKSNMQIKTMLENGEFTNTEIAEALATIDNNIKEQKKALAESYAGRKLLYWENKKIENIHLWQMAGLDLSVVAPWINKFPIPFGAKGHVNFSMLVVNVLNKQTLETETRSFVLRSWGAGLAFGFRKGFQLQFKTPVLFLTNGTALKLPEEGTAADELSVKDIDTYYGNASASLAFNAERYLYGIGGELNANWSPNKGILLGEALGKLGLGSTPFIGNVGFTKLDVLDTNGGLGLKSRSHIYKMILSEDTVD